MIRLHFVVEGQTEETFVRDVLSVDLEAYDIFADAHRVTTGRRRGRTFRGGLVSYAHLRNDLKRWASEDRRADARFTTMIDLYRLPPDFPEAARFSPSGDPLSRVQSLEEAFGRDISEPRFLPFIQLHEFEALLFSDPAAFQAAFPNRSKQIEELYRIRDAFPSPEYIDNGESTSPSKRICQLFPDYEKQVSGALIAARIGLESMAAECAHFGSWLAALRALR